MLINTLQTSKVTSGMISGRLVEAEETEQNINERARRTARRRPRIHPLLRHRRLGPHRSHVPVLPQFLHAHVQRLHRSTRASRAGRMARDLARGRRRLRRRGSDGRRTPREEAAAASSAEDSDEDSDEDDEDAKVAEALARRLDGLMRYTTRFMFENVCRGLFEEHKLLYSFLLCTASFAPANPSSPRSGTSSSAARRSLRRPG